MSSEIDLIYQQLIIDMYSTYNFNPQNNKPMIRLKKNNQNRIIDDYEKTLSVLFDKNDSQSNMLIMKKYDDAFKQKNFDVMNMIKNNWEKKYNSQNFNTCYNDYLKYSSYLK